ncbi:cellulase family glycosylhydrolase [Kineococcus sp. SYSU DK004]|uniref:cellulase family glycosylhydrolase n=1 Tax=Kineococcus sp. SYSU DK004 TaxID=3383125 RepID=UPI003D7CD94C
MSGRPSRMRLVHVVLSLLVAVSLATAPAAGASSAPSPAPSAPTGSAPSVGVHVHGTWSTYTDAERLVVLDRLAAAGVGWIRLDLGWASYEERCSGCTSQWYVDRADRVIDAARARGIKVLAQVGMTPVWASPGGGTNAPPADVREFGRFMRWLSAHLAGRVDAYEIWNEPNLKRFWNGTPAQYVRLAQVGYSAVKDVDPGVPVVLGGTSYNDTSWLRQAYDAGAAGSFDVLATHPYLAPSDQAPGTADTKGTNIYLLTHVASVRRLMVERGDGHKQIWFTEFGWSNHQNTGTESNWNRGVTEQQQAEFLLQTLDLVRTRYPYVTHVFWYNDRDRGVSSSHIDNYGLLRRDLSVKPAYTALQSRLRPTAASAVPASAAERPVGVRRVVRQVRPAGPVR